MQRPFLVTPERECIPLEGPYRVESVRGEWYVLGEHRVLRCADERDAQRALAALASDHDPDERVEEALEGLSDDFVVVTRPS